MDRRDVARNRERFDRVFALLDGVRDKVVAMFHSVTPSQADRRPADNEWSIAEIAHHLAITERAYLGMVADLAAAAPPHEFAYDEVVRTRPFRIEDTWNIGITGTLPTPPELLPTPGRSLPQLEADLQAARTRSRHILAPYRDQDLGVKFFVHPRLGSMTLYERTEQIAYHELKHLKQMERVLARLAA